VVPGGVFAVGCMAQFLFWTFGDKPWVLSLLLMIGSFFSGTIFFQRIHTHHATQDIAAWIHALPSELGAEGRILMPTPCSEESGNLGSMSGVRVGMLGTDSIPQKLRHGPLVLITHPNCIVRPIEGFHFDTPVFQEGQWRAYRQEMGSADER
jgi:hypothetical protein